MADKDNDILDIEELDQVSGGKFDSRKVPERPEIVLPAKGPFFDQREPSKGGSRPDNK
ncbi:hypothetical protein SAMN02910456_02334 [Ruminococcaceae bacterium YRB3002]|nr:hypothetical protein SAMN02910456_02334 [Ruminococcaceae bacterium YRB3002]